MCAVFHQGMKQRGENSGRADERAADGGDRTFGKSGGGHGGIHTDLIASPMSPDMCHLPKENK